MVGYKPVGVDSNGRFPTRVETALKALFSTKIKRGTAKTSAGTLEWGVPGTSFHGVSTSPLVANEVRYVPFEVKTATVVTALAFEVTTGPTAAANVALGIYATDGFHQPTGTPVYAAPSTTVASAFTGVKSVTGLSVTLQPGTYLLAMNVDQAMTVRTYLAPTPTIVNGLGASPLGIRYYAAQAYSVTPANPTPWTSVTPGTTGLSFGIVAQWTE